MLMNLFLAILAITAMGGYALSSPPKEAPQKPALDVPYEPTSYGIAKEMLNMAGVTSKDLIYDLGCGDGRIVIMAAKERGARGIGVDLDPQRIRESKENAEAAGISHLVRFFEQNLFDTDIRQATVIMLYLYPEVNLKLRPKLLKELKPGTRIVSHSHTMGEWEDDATKTVEGHILHFFVIPANVTGAWKWTDPDGENISLALTQKFQRVKGTLSVGMETYPLIGASLRGNRFRFAVERQVRGSWETFLFKGQISGDAITGKMTSGTTAQRVNNWQATRDPSTIAPIAE
jgi:SAM-dependent methyltransferase